MIYFFDNELNMVKVVTSKNVISAVHEHELNGLILGTVEVDLSYTEAFINDVDYFGYYYKDNYYLHKIKRVEHEHENELVRITGRHIFFEDMLYGDYIRDVRPENRDALYILNQTISVNTRWQTVMTDTSKLHSETYYWVPPMEVLNDLTENVGIEYEPRILFDGQNINGFQLHVANRIGEDTPIRVPFGSRVLSLKYEVDYSEIVTALYGHGKGEEVGDGYGRRINFSSVNFSRNGVVSRPGSLFMENPEITAQYGKDDGSPKFGRIIFEDIESASELANATYEAYLEQSRPKMLFEASVVDLGDVGMGDGVLIIRREYDVYFNARIHKLMVDLLDAENADVELGDYAHFKESKVQRKTRENNNQYRRETSSRIQQLKEQFNDRFDGEVKQMREDFEQALIDAHAEIEASEQRMETLIEYERNTMMDEFNESVQEARNYAEQQAQERADAVRTDLETVTSGHQSMLDDLESNVMNIDDFLGDSREVTLDERFYSINESFEERIRRVDSNTFNMLRGSQLNEPDVYTLFTGATLDSSERINFVNVMTLQSSWTAPRVRFEQEVRIEAGKKYIFAVEYRTDSVPELDWFRIQRDDGLTNLIPYSDGELLSIQTDGEWNRAITEFTFDRTITGKFEIGTHYASGDGSREPLHIRLPYLTGSENTEWVYHPLDATQNISEVSRRITNLEDGYSELTTRSEFDFKTGNLDQYIKSVEDTVEGNTTVLQRVENWQATNGASIEETVYGFNQKVWLNDVAEIGANLIPQSSNAWEDGSFWSLSGTPNPDTSNIRMKNRIRIIPGETYTLACYSNYWSTVSSVQTYEYLNDDFVRNRRIGRSESITFVAEGDEIILAVFPPGLPDWTNISTSQMDHIEYPVQIKLERGAEATPMLNALSRVEQLADSYSVQIAELDGTYLKQSSLEITPEYAQIGSMRIDGDTVGSLLRVSPSGIDAVAEAMRLSGDLYVDGDITAIAVDAIAGNFAEIYASTADVDFIQARHLNTDSIRARHLYVTNVMVDKFMANTAFVNDIKSLSIESIYADLRSVNSEIMTSNIIKSNWLNVDAALANKFNANAAFINRLEVKAANIRDLDVIDIHANTFSSTVPGSNREITMYDGRARFRYGSVTIETTSGRKVIIDGYLNRSSSVVARTPSFMGSTVSVEGSWFRIDQRTYTTAHMEHYVHEARYLRANIALNRWGYTGEIADARIRAGGITSGYVSTQGKGDGTHYDWITVDLGEPLDRPIMGTAEYQFSNRHRLGAVAMHLGNRFLTDDY